MEGQLFRVGVSYQKSMQIFTLKVYLPIFELCLIQPQAINLGLCNILCIWFISLHLMAGVDIMRLCSIFTTFKGWKYYIAKSMF